MLKRSDIIAVLPAAGQATRLSPLPCSKEILPVGLGHDLSLVASRIKVVSHYLLEGIFCAGIRECVVILDPSKMDIPRYLGGNGGIDGLNIVYRYIEDSPNTPTTLNIAFPLVCDKWVALGFPDMMFSDRDIFARLVHQYETGVDVLMGLFPATQPHNVDMVDVGADGWVRHVLMKPSQSTLTRTWGVALWGPRFSQFMNEYLKKNAQMPSLKELFVGDIIVAAIQDGLHVKGVDVSESPYLDIGTVENYARLFSGVP